MLKSCLLCFLALAAIEIGTPSISLAQAAPTASRAVTIQVGGGLSIANSDFSYAYIKGASIYGTMDFTSHLGIEGDIHDTSFFTPDDIGQTSYLLGLRYGFNKNRFHPYAKVQAGLGVFHYKAPTYYADDVLYKIFAFGGGVDYRLTPKVNLRLVDIESQHWPTYGAHGLTPTMVTVGAAYRF